MNQSEVLGLALVLSLSACAAAPSNDAALDESADEEALSTGAYTYYTVARDTRRCAAPMCGGYWLTRVNRWEEAKYVGSLDTTRLGLDDAELDDLLGHVASGQVVLRGALPGAAYGALRTYEAWLAPEPVAAKGTFYRVKDTGLRCITGPCPNLSVVKLNSATTFSAAAVDLSSFGSADDDAQAVQALSTSDGLLVQGTTYTITGAAATAKGVRARAYWTRYVHTACNPAKVAEEYWSSRVPSDGVFHLAASEAEGAAFVDPGLRSVYWLAPATTDSVTSWVAGINDLWAVRYDVNPSSCALTVTGEH